LASQTNPAAHVLPRHAEDDPLPTSAADRDVDVGVSGVEVLDAHPLEVEAQVPLHRCHELARVLAEIESLPGLGRDDELPKTRISRLFPLGEAPRDVDPLLASIEAEAALSLLLRAFPREVPTVGSPVRAPAIRRIPHLDNALLQQRRRKAEEARARARRASPPALLAPKPSRNPAESARARSSALAPNSAGTKPHLEALGLGVLHRGHSPAPCLDRSVALTRKSIALAMKTIATLTAVRTSAD